MVGAFLIDVSVVFGLLVLGAGFWWLFTGISRRDEASQELQVKHRANDEEQRHQRHLATIRTNQRVDALAALRDLEIAKMNNETSQANSKDQVEIARLQTNAAVEAERYKAMGVAGDREFTRQYAKFQHDLDMEKLRVQENIRSQDIQQQREYDSGEAQKDRTWRSDESREDREARVDTVKAKVESEIRLLESRHRIENPSTEEEAKRKDFQFETKMNTLQRITQLAQTDTTSAQTMFEMWERGEL